MTLYHKWDVKNGFAYVLTFFSLISDSLGGVYRENTFVCDDPQADPRGAGQARRVRVGGGGAVRSRPLALGVALAPLGPCDLPRPEHCQARQPGQLQAVPPRHPHLLPPPRHHWHGLTRSGQR